MTRFKKWIALGLSSVMVASTLLAGCGNGNSTNDTKTPAQTDTASAGDNAADTTGESDNTAAAGKVSLPLTEEKQTLTIWTKNDVSMLNACGGDLNNAPFYKELEERTNVHIEWVVPAAGSETEQLNLMFTSGELTDLIFISPGILNYGDGLDAAIDDGYFLDLTDYLPEYAPNYMAVLNNNEEAKKAATTDSNRYALMYTIRKEAQPPFMGLVVRQDWLDDLGLEKPVTFDDWENMLTKFKEEKGATAPLTLTPYSLWALSPGMGVYGDYNGHFYQIDGKVYNSLIDNTENVREYLTMMNRWYTNGLIDPDFASETISSYYGNPVLISNGATGAFNTMYTLPSSTYIPIMGEGAALSAVLAPVKNEGDTLHYRMTTSFLDGAYAISADCENPELAIRWIDYLFTEEGMLLANYGTEGDTYTLDENGNPQFTDLVLNNPDDLSFDECLRTYTLAPGMPAGLVDYKRELQYVPSEDAEMMNVWNMANADYVYPSNVQLSAEENAEYSTLYADIGTFIQENTLSFVTGAKSLDEFDAFIETVKGMGIDRCVELKQSALDRYNAK